MSREVDLILVVDGNTPEKEKMHDVQSYYSKEAICHSESKTSDTDTHLLAVLQS
jgi:hypothetical protein